MQSFSLRIIDRIGRIIRWPIIIGAAVMAFLVIHFGFPNLPDKSQDMLALLAAIFVLLVGLLTSEHLLQLQRQKSELQKKLDQADKHTRRLIDRLETVKHINSQLLEGNDETNLIEKALSSIAGMTGASGCSFVPYDEWGQPMPSFVFGNISEGLLVAWHERLASLEVRRTCKRCQKLATSTQSECPLAPNPFKDAATIHCFPLEREERPVGMFNLFMPIGNEIDSETRSFIESLMDELAVGLEVIRLERQFMSALKQVKLGHGLAFCLDDSLHDLLEQLLPIIEFPAGLLTIRLGGYKTDDLRIEAGQHALITSQDVKVYLAEVLRSGGPIFPLAPPRLNDQDADNIQAIIPIQVQNKTIYGALFLFSDKQEIISDMQLALLKMVASQIAMMVQYDRVLENLEYEAVIRERTRLAREIHDGLAQTLAYLKLQTGQMRNHLTKGDFSRLEQYIQANYQAISDAYNEVRQAIDNLRLTPQNGIKEWFTRITNDFSRASDIKVTQVIAPQIYELSDEIQVQLIRIVQECLSNIRKHARASQVWLTVKVVESDFVLEVRDNGRGFEADDDDPLQSHGLRGMRERALMIGADLKITSQEGAGTTIQLQLPLGIEEVI